MGIPLLWRSKSKQVNVNVKQMSKDLEPVEAMQHSDDNGHTKKLLFDWKNIISEMLHYMMCKSN